MSVSSIAPISIEALDAVYTARNYAQAVGFAVAAPARRPQEKDVRSEDDAINAALRESEKVAVSPPVSTFRRNNERQGDRKNRHKRKFANFADMLDDEEQQPSFDSYA